MPPLDDVDTLVSCDGGGGGGAELKAAWGCDTALSDDGSGTEERDGGDGDGDDDPYAPAQSLRLRIGEDIEWSEVVVGAAAAAVLERDDSTKGAGANPTCAARRSVAAAAAAAGARGSMPHAAASRAVVAVVIGGLPAGKAAREHGRSPRRLVGGGRARRVFAAGGEVVAADRLAAEPGSPKVSCLGGVRSQPRAAAEGVGSATGSGRRWWAWLAVADVASCCWNGRPERRRARASGSEAD